MMKCYNGTTTPDNHDNTDNPDNNDNTDNPDNKLFTFLSVICKNEVPLYLN